MVFLDLGEIGEQFADADIGGALGGARVEAVRLELHRFRLLADSIERQIAGHPNRPTADKTLDVFTTDWRQIGAEPILVKLQQHVAVVLLLLGHFGEQPGGVWIAFREVFGEGQINPAVFFLTSDCNGENFTFRQFGKGLHPQRHPTSLEGF